MKRTLLMSLSVLALAACTTPTTYAPAGEGRYGFAENQIESNRWSVRFSGNSLTELPTVQNYLIYRAAELTTEQGFDHFIVVDRQTDEETRLRTVGIDPLAAHFHYRYYNPRWGWRHHRDPFFNDVDLREISRYEASAEIVMGRGPKPESNPQAYSAQDVLRTLAPEVQRNEVAG